MSSHRYEFAPYCGFEGHSTSGKVVKWLRFKLSTVWERSTAPLRGQLYGALLSLLIPASMLHISSLWTVMKLCCTRLSERNRIRGSLVWSDSVHNDTFNPVPQTIAGPVLFLYIATLTIIIVSYTVKKDSGDPCGSPLSLSILKARS